jgi:hypothetical protein
VEILGDPKGRRDDFVKPYFSNAQPDRVVVIIKAREPAGYTVAIGGEKSGIWKPRIRWVQQFNFYIQDAEWGPMFVRVCWKLLVQGNPKTRCLEKAKFESVRMSRAAGVMHSVRNSREVE